jgi:dihydroorotase
LYAFPDDPNLSNNGFANEGYVATELGFRAAPNESEEIAISRDILLTRLTQGSIHIGPITTKGSSDLIKRAKKEKLNLTAFTASHYLKLTDGIFYDLLGSAKVFPPFRSEEDRQAIIQACQNGTIDILVSDHSPHPPFEVEQEIDRAPFGISTLETAVAVAVEVLIHEAGLSPMIIPQLFSWNPCKRFNLPLGYLQEGTEANITCMDPNKKMEITEKIFSGRSKNNPFIGQMLRGFPSTLIAKGKLVLKDGSLVENL